MINYEGPPMSWYEQPDYMCLDYFEALEDKIKKEEEFFINLDDK